LLAPHCAQSHTALGKGYRHAVHARDRVKQRPERMLAVLCDRAGSTNVLHQEDASLFEAASNAGEDIVRPRLIVDRVKGRYKVIDSIRRFAIKGREIADFKVHIPQP
jgi:hypothetical protein